MQVIEAVRLGVLKRSDLGEAEADDDNDDDDDDDSNLAQPLLDRAGASHELLKKTEVVLNPMLLGACCSALPQKTAISAYQTYLDTLVGDKHVQAIQSSRSTKTSNVC